MNSNQRKKIAIIGIQGVPSKYGGFETLVEHLIEDDSAEFTVFFLVSKVFRMISLL